jgi:hypothetical protein
MKTEQSEKTSPSLSRAKESNVAERIIFQRDHTVAEPCAEKTPAGFAQGMSRAMGLISRQILLDLQKALKSR